MRKTESKGIREKLLKPIGRSGFKWLVIALMAAFGVMLMLGGKGDSGRSDAAFTVGRFEEYTLRTETRIKELCESVDGVGETRVVVTFTGTTAFAVSSEETVYDAEISGIGIVCEGGDDPKVVMKLLSLISAACDVPTSRIYIAGAEKDLSLQS